MTQHRGYRRFFRFGLGPGDSPESQIDEEIETHLALRIESLIRSGLASDTARAEAIRRFGDLEEARRRLRAGARRRAARSRLREWLGSWAGDVRLAGRQAARAPVFTAVVLATLALGIGSTTATFTLVRSVLLQPLPFPSPEQLVQLSSVDSVMRVVPVVSSADWLDWRRESRVLASTAIHQSRRFGVVGGGEAHRLWGSMVAGDFFAVLGSNFVVGRAFSEAEVEEARPVAVVSEAFWRGSLGGVWPIDRPLLIDSHSFRVIGVVRSGQEYPAGSALWVPVPVEAEVGMARNRINWVAIARLRAGTRRTAAAAELSGIARAIRAGDPAALYSYGVNVAPLKASVVGDAPSYLPLLLGAVGLVLLVACANLAAGHLARGAAREPELAVRAALGAGRRRLLRQLLVEHGMLGLVGGGLGMVVAWAGLRVILAKWGAEIPRAAEIRLDAPMVALTALLAVGSGLLAGLGPATRASGASPRGLIVGTRGRVSGGRGMPGAGLIAVEVALAFLLLSGAGLLIRSLDRLLARNLGFDPAVVTISASLSGERYDRNLERRTAYWESVRRALAALPGVDAVGAANWVPLEFAGRTFVDVDGGSVPAGMGYRVVSEGYFRALRVPVEAGRTFSSADAATGERVAVVNRRAASLAWPGQNPIGRRLRATSFEGGTGEAPWLTVVGVVGDLRQWGPSVDPDPELYVLLRQMPRYGESMTVVVHPTGDPERLVPLARAAAQAVDPSVAIEVGALSDALDRQLASRRLAMSLLSGFGGFALLLTAIGLYGLLTYSLTRRARELALRAALGADRAGLVRLVARHGLSLVGAGLLAGAAATVVAGRVMTSLLADVSPLDPWGLGLAATVLLAVTTAAILVPALRLTRLDPASVLQAEA